jgi:hypothetical protein
MRVAAGIVLILAAVINLFAALGFIAGGGVMSLAGSGTINKILEDTAKKEGRELSPEQKAQMAEMRAHAGEIKGLVAYGFLLLGAAVMAIVGAVSLFQGKRRKLIVAAAIVLALAEIAGTFVTGFGFLNVVGLAGALLAFLGARAVAAARSGGGTPETSAAA